MCLFHSTTWLCELVGQKTIKELPKCLEADQKAELHPSILCVFLIFLNKC